MGYWFTFFIWAATFVLSDYFRPRLPSQTPNGLGDFSIPTATEGRYIPVMAGTMRIDGGNCTWYGDFTAQRRTVTTGVIFREKETIGYTYFLALQYAQVHTEVAGITGIWIGDDKVYEGAATEVVDVDRPDLFGGVDEGGGFTGRFRLFRGTQSQGVSAFLASRLDPLPAYRGTAYVMITDVAETGGANIGESNNLRHIRFELQAFDTVANGGLGDVLSLGNDHHFIGADINPVAFAYEVYTNDDWGGAYAASDFGLASFQAAAETIFTEGLGYSRIWTDATNAEQIINEIEQHIDGYIGPNPLTGLIEVNLSRGGYTLANEFQADATNILGVPKWSKSDWTQTKNEIRLQYADRTKSYKDTFAKAQSLANRIIQGRPEPLDIRFPGVHTAAVANAIVWRIARSRFRALTTGTVEIDRTAWQLKPADIMSFTDVESSETNLPVRINRVGRGEINDMAISLEVVQDTFGNETVGSAAPPASDFVPPVQAVGALAVADQAAFEAPFALMQYATLSGTVPRIATLARATSGLPTQYEVVRRVRTPPTAFSGPYTTTDAVLDNLASVGTLRAALTAWQDGNGTFTVALDPIGGASLDSLIGLYEPSVTNAGGIAVVDPGTATEEFLIFTSIVDDGAGIRLESVYRAGFDTPMEAHALGARVWLIWAGGLGLGDEQYTAGDGVEMKFLPKSPSASVAEGDATALAEVSLANPPRNARPLLPVALDMNGTNFPATPVSFDIPHTSPNLIGLRVAPTYRLWSVGDPLSSVQGFASDAEPIEAADLANQNLRISAWLYDLDTTPSPSRGDSLITITDQAVAAQGAPLNFSRDDLEDAGITADFAARIEIETKHSPPGQIVDQVSLEPLFFDFDITGTFGTVQFAYSEVSFHSHFDGADAATAATDESATANTITFAGNAQLDTAQAQFGASSLLLDGTGDYVSIPDGATQELAANDFTIEAWVRYTALPSTVASTGMAIVGKWDSGNARRAYNLRIIDTNEVVFQWSTDGSTTQQITASDTPSFAVDEWHHVAVTRAGDVLRLFFDGVLLTTSGDSIAGDTINDNVEDVRIGATNTSGFESYHNGHIDEVRIINGTAAYTASFTPETDEFFFHRVSLLAGFTGADGATALTEESRHQAVATFNGNAQIDDSQFRFNTTSLLLDGTGDYVTFPDSVNYEIGNRAFTLDAFVRWSTDPGSSTETIMGHYSPTGDQRGWLLDLNNNQLRFGWTTDGTGGTFGSLTGAFNPVAGQWYHLAVCRDASNQLRLFADGVELGSVANAVTYFAPASALGVGANADGTGIMTACNVDEVRLILDKALYTAAFTSPAAAFPRA